MNKLTLAQAEEYKRRKCKLKTGTELKALASEIRDRHGLTDQEAFNVFNGVTDLLEIAKQEIERLKEENERLRDTLYQVQVQLSRESYMAAEDIVDSAIQRIQEEGKNGGK